MWIWWRHEHPKKTVRPPKIAVSSHMRPLIIAHQSPGDFPRPVRDVLEAQIALARRAISPGPIDGSRESVNLRLNLLLSTSRLADLGSMKPVPPVNFTPLVLVVAEKSYVSDRARAFSSFGTNPLL